MRRTFTQGLAHTWDLVLGALYYVVGGLGCLAFGAFCLWFVGAMAGASTDEVDAMLGWVLVLGAIFAGAAFVAALCFAADWAVRRLPPRRR